jgi:hypothetical protein
MTVEVLDCNFFVSDFYALIPALLPTFVSASTYYDYTQRCGCWLTGQGATGWPVIGVCLAV